MVYRRKLGMTKSRSEMYRGNARVSIRLGKKSSKLTKEGLNVRKGWADNARHWLNKSKNS